MSKTLDDPQAAMYKPGDEQSSVITLECASSGLKIPHNDIKIETPVEGGAVAGAVLGGSVPTAVVTGAATVSADTWTPLTPPQSTLQ